MVLSTQGCLPAVSGGLRRSAGAGGSWSGASSTGRPASSASGAVLARCCAPGRTARRDGKQCNAVTVWNVRERRWRRAKAVQKHAKAAADGAAVDVCLSPVARHAGLAQQAIRLQCSSTVYPGPACCEADERLGCPASRSGDRATPAYGCCPLQSASGARSQHGREAASASWRCQPTVEQAPARGLTPNDLLSRSRRSVAGSSPSVSTSASST